MSGTAAQYDIRCARFPISEANWQECNPVAAEKPLPLPAGKPQEITITGLEDRSLYFFAIKTADEAGNWSPVSNIVSFAICEGGCVGIRGNFDADQMEQVDIADLVRIVEYLFDGSYPPACPEEGNINGDPNGTIDISDLSYLVNFLFEPGAPAPPACP